MNKKIIFILVGLAVAGMAYYYSLKKKTAAQADAPFIPAHPANAGETSKALKVPVEDASVIDERRNTVTDLAAANPDVKPVVTVAETLTTGSHKIPILGYGKEGSRNQTLVFIPVEDTSIFTSSSGTGTLSRSISTKVTINTGKYAGTWNAWYLYTNFSWGSKRTNLYIDAPWKD